MSKQSVYYIAYTRGIPRGPCYNGSRQSTLIVETARSIDCLSPDIWLYHGPREVTKAQLKDRKAAILADANAKRPTKWQAFSRVVIR